MLVASSPRTEKSQQEAPAKPADAPAPRRVDREDIPRPLRRVRPMGRVQLVLDEGERTEVLGIVYGLEHTIRAPGYRVKIFLDSYNRRIKVLDYKADDYKAMILKLRFIATANRFDKIWIKASERDWMEFLKFGYVLEGVLQHFNRGKPAYLVSKFRSQRRLQSRHLMKETLLIEEILARPRSPTRPLPRGYAIDYAREDDLDGMLALYQQVFKTYPSPLKYREYLRAVLHRDAIFRVVRRDGSVVAVASAELDPPHLAAELTDCATHPGERGKGLMGAILQALEGDLRRRGYRCAYTMARARSYGMNAAFHSLGYEFNGRMINNCDIYGAFEDMNLWVKNLRAPERTRPRRAARKPRT